LSPWGGGGGGVLFPCSGPSCLACSRPSPDAVKSSFADFPAFSVCCSAPGAALPGRFFASSFPACVWWRGENDENFRNFGGRARAGGSAGGEEYDGCNEKESGEVGDLAFLSMPRIAECICRYRAGSGHPRALFGFGRYGLSLWEKPRRMERLMLGFWELGSPR
jgi:hypothetical protein